MIDNDLDAHYLKQEDYNCKVFLDDGSVYAVTVYKIDTEETAHKRIKEHFRKLYPNATVTHIVAVTATDTND